MEVVYRCCCGIDVHKKLIVACLNEGGKRELRALGTTTSESKELANWLTERRCEMIAMESTGVYWKPLYNLFELLDLDAIIVNAAHMKALPERKTDVKIVTVTDGLKNDHRCRVIPLHAELIGKISSQSRVAYIGGNATKGVAPTPVITKNIFHAPEGGPYTPMNWTNRVFKPFMEDLHSAHPDVPALNPHELRHTRATLWKDDGVDLFSIAKLLGHSDLDMLAKRYAHNNIDTLRRAIGIECVETDEK